MKRPATDLWTGMQPPSLPQGLRQRVLSRARTARRPRPTWVDRLWENRSLRLAWVLGVVALLGVQLFLAAGMPAGRRAPAGESASAQWVAAEPDLAAYLARNPIRREPPSTWLQASRQGPG